MKSIVPFIPLTLLTAGVYAQNATEGSLPNVVLILTDDMGIGDVGCYGQRTIPTPNIDTLAKHGMQFMQHYSGSSVSAPSRCSLLTGMHVGHASIRGNYVDRREGTDIIYDYNLPKEDITIADVFKKAGYSTALTGKWGMGEINTEGCPLRHGFDYFFGYETQVDAHRAYPDHLWENGRRVELDKKTYADEMIVGKALNFIERTDGPFFLEIATTLPHAELLVPPEERARFEGLFKETPFPGGWYAAQDMPRATFAAMITRIDNTVGRVVDALKKKGALDNTMIIFTSDNGTHLEGGHDPYYFNSNSLYRGTKRDLYQGGIITPLIVRWPGNIAEGSVSYHVSAFWDFLPTFCDIAGVAKPEGLDGISMLPELTGKGEQQKHDHLYFEFHEEGGKQAVIKDGWKLIKLRAGSDRPVFELYNIQQDPKELRDVSSKFPWKIDELKVIMENSRTENPVWHFQD